MCPACMAAAAVTAAKVASLGGLTAYGVRTLLFRPAPEPVRLAPTIGEHANDEPPAEKTDDPERA